MQGHLGPGEGHPHRATCDIRGERAGGDIEGTGRRRAETRGTSAPAPSAAVPSASRGARRRDPLRVVSPTSAGVADCTGERRMARPFRSAGDRAGCRGACAVLRAVRFFFFLRSVSANWGLTHRAARSSSSRRASRALRYGRPYLCPTGRAPSSQLSWCWCSAPPSKPPAAEMAGGATSAAPRRPCSPAQLRMRNRSHHSARPHQWQAGSAPRRYWDWQSPGCAPHGSRVIQDGLCQGDVGGTLTRSRAPFGDPACRVTWARVTLHAGSPRGGPDRVRVTPSPLKPSSGSCTLASSSNQIYIVTSWCHSRYHPAGSNPRDTVGVFRY